MTLASGACIGWYEIRGSLGAGGMGEVYRAHDPRLGRDVALKILPESMAKDPEGLARFTREARAVAALNHPHIVTIFSTEEADGVRFMTMELIEGRTLDRMIPEGGVSLAQFFDVSMALADALSAAHQKQITHRDLKPANVMVTDAGRVKVLDFGLARGGEGADSGATSIEEQATRHKLTQAGTILGTMPYMSPEQIEAKVLDGRSDIFSLGIVMYEMATGGRPFRGQTSPALMSSIMREHPKTATELRPDLPIDVSRLMGKCLEKNLRDRVQTAHEVLVELKALRRAWESGASASERPGASAKPTPPAVPVGGAAPAPSGSRASNFRIAVLPFVSRTTGGDAEALADGLTDDITAGLARFQYLRVVSRPDAEAVKGQAADARAGLALGARYLLDGTVRTSGTTVRISARLVVSQTGSHLWVETFDRSLGWTKSAGQAESCTLVTS
ncbi:MAG: protein kinase [Vicinamibacteria bacterium]|nr:protein kinase [Vicinamibacteria bacterium]